METMTGKNVTPTFHPTRRILCTPMVVVVSTTPTSVPSVKLT